MVHTACYGGESLAAETGADANIVPIVRKQRVEYQGSTPFLFSFSLGPQSIEFRADLPLKLSHKHTQIFFSDSNYKSIAFAVKIKPQRPSFPGETGIWEIPSFKWLEPWLRQKV